MLGFPTFVCAATAVGSLNANAESLLAVENTRDITVSTAGAIVFLGLLTMLLEGVIILFRFVAQGAFNAKVVSRYIAVMQLIMHLT